MNVPRVRAPRGDSPKAPWLALSLLLAAPSLRGAVAASAKPAPTPTPALAKETVAITGAIVWTMDGPPIENAKIVIEDGVVTTLTGEPFVVPANARRIEGTGKIVTPGFVDAATSLGLVEIDLVSETREDHPSGEGPIRAAFRAADGIDPESTLLAVTRMEGVTAAVTRPNGGLIAGQSAWIRLAAPAVRPRGSSVDDLIVRAPLAMHGALGAEGRGAAGDTRGGALRRLREALEDARLIRSRTAAFDENRMRALAAGRLDLMALWPVLDRKLPLVVSVNKASDIEIAIRVAEEEKIRLVIEGAAEGWKVADLLAARRVPVLVKPLENLPRYNALGTRFDNTALLAKAGVTFAIVTGEAHNVRNLRQEAGNAIAWGLPREKALEAVTRTPAEIFGLEGQAGSIAKGRRADLVLWSGDPFELSSRPEAVFVDGREIPLRSRQTDLLDRYRTLPPKR